MVSLARIGQALIRGYYCILKKTLPTDASKIVFLTRQSNSPSLDFRLLVDELRRLNPEVTPVFIGKRMGTGRLAKLDFGITQLQSLYHLATARVAILESYWPAVSIVKHKPELTVFQLWHAMGKVKESGCQTVGKPQGWPQEIAQALHMHEGYDYVIAGGEAWNAAYHASFGIDTSKLLNLGLPRADFLLNNQQHIKDKILTHYPALAGKPVVLYAPTFRRGGGVGLRAKNLMKALDLEEYSLIVKGHANQPLLTDRKDVFSCPEFSGMELLAVADFLITDYSAIAVEAALIGKKTFYYLYDYDVYQEQNGLNLDLPEEFPELVFFEARALVKALRREYPSEALQRYQDKYLFKNLGRSTELIVDAIFAKGKLCRPA